MESYKCKLILAYSLVLLLRCPLLLGALLPAMLFDFMHEFGSLQVGIALLFYYEPSL